MLFPFDIPVVQLRPEVLKDFAEAFRFSIGLLSSSSRRQRASGFGWSLPSLKALERALSFRARGKRQPIRQRPERGPSG